MKNWKTTLAGVGMILSGVGGIATNIAGQGDMEMAACIGLIIGGIGLLTAGDARVS